MKNLTLLFIICLIGTVYAQTDPNGNIPIVPSESNGLSQEFMGYLPADVMTEIEQRKVEAERKREELEDAQRNGQDEVEGLLNTYYDEVYAKRDEILSNLTVEQRQRVEERLIEIQEKIETRNASLEEDLTNK